MDICAGVRAFVADLGTGGHDLPDPIAMAHAIDPSVATTARFAVDVLVADGPGRGAMEIDRLGVGGREPTVDIVTTYPQEHFFSVLQTLLR
jgi:inosine-uridine nucleoside N-ribohydrolase